MKRIFAADGWCDSRSENPDLNKGMTGAELRFMVEDEIGQKTILCVQTNWFPDNERRGFHERGQCEQLAPYARRLICVDADGGVLSPTVAGHEATALAPVIFESLVEDGVEKLWFDLESVHTNTFGKAPETPASLPETATQAQNVDTPAPTPAPAAQDASKDTYTVTTPLGFEGRIVIEVKG